MAKFIKNIHDRINFATKKGLTGYHPPDKIDAEVHAESMNLWKKYIDEFERTEKISMYMVPFQDYDDLVLSTGIGTISSYKDKYITLVSAPGNKKIEILDTGHFNDRLNHPLKAPTADYPVCVFSFKTNSISVYPTSITSATIYFLKKPTKPVYAYSVSGTRYVYDDSSSVDIEWSELLHDEIMNRVLSNLGINIREPQLIQYANLEQQKEGR